MAVNKESLRGDEMVPRTSQPRGLVLMFQSARTESVALLSSPHPATRVALRVGPPEGWKPRPPVPISQFSMISSKCCGPKLILKRAPRTASTQILIRSSCNQSHKWKQSGEEEESSRAAAVRSRGLMGEMSPMWMKHISVVTTFLFHPINLHKLP